MIVSSFNSEAREQFWSLGTCGSTHNQRCTLDSPATKQPPTHNSLGLEAVAQNSPPSITKTGGEHNSYWAKSYRSCKPRSNPW
jgi:hypothetical protein